MPIGRQPSPRDRIIATALFQITSEGLTVGLDHLSLEKVIAASGVSRATAYRIWPNKQRFLADVITAAVQSTHLEGESEQDVGRILALLAEHPDFSSNADSHRQVVVDGLRISVEADLRRIVSSPTWSTYLALGATSHGLPKGVLRTEVTAALASADQRFTAHRMALYARLPRLLGYRLRPPLDEESGLLLLSQAMGAMMTGFVVKIRTQPDLLTESFELAAFGAGSLTWTAPTFALTGLVLSYLEPDPAATWGPDQRHGFDEALTEIMEALGAVDP